MLTLAPLDGVVKRLQAACRVLLALHPLLEELAATGIVTYRPSQEIGGVADERMYVQGLAWLAGKSLDKGRPLVSLVQRFVDRGMDALADVEQQD
jgi:hypothetical protein